MPIAGPISKLSALFWRMSSCVLTPGPTHRSSRAGRPRRLAAAHGHRLHRGASCRADFARHSGAAGRLSPFYFCRAFKQSFGLPPHRYHNGRRIERAKSLLAKPASSVTEIGMTVGFSETSSFSAAFRKATGPHSDRVSPKPRIEYAGSRPTVTRRHGPMDATLRNRSNPTHDRFQCKIRSNL